MKDLKIKIRNFTAEVICWGVRLSGTVSKKEKEIYSKRYVTTLYFHNPTKKYFEMVLKIFFKKGYRIISLDELISYLYNKKEIGEKAVWLSFDDGWKGNISNVVPLIKKYKLYATFFISTDPVENTGAFWWTYARKYQNYLPAPYNKQLSLLWEIDEKKRREIMNEVYQRFHKRIKREAMTIKDIQQLSSIPTIDIGSHTVHHAILPNCDNKELEFEIGESKKVLEEWTGREIKSLSYPNGDFDGREKKVLQKYGYVLAATTENAFITPTTDPFYVPRISLMNEGSKSEALCRIVGLWKEIVDKFRK